MSSAGGDFYRALGQQMQSQTSVCSQLNKPIVHSSSWGGGGGQRRAEGVAKRVMSFTWKHEARGQATLPAQYPGLPSLYLAMS